MTRTFAHLIDDGKPGGVNRMLDFMASCPELAATSVHKIVPIRRGQLSAPRLEADAIVSNLVVSWANFPLFAALRAAYPNIPLIHVEHSYCERFVALHVDNKDRFETLMRSVYGMFDHIVAVSEPQGAWIRRKGFVQPDRLHVIEPLADLTPFLALAAPETKTKHVIGALGRFEEQKGFDILVKAFRQAKPSHLELHLFGDGAQREELMALAGGDPRIVFNGFAENPAAAMAACDMIAMPSRWEPYGMVAIEAMAAARPLVCSRADGLLGHIRAGAIDVGENTATGWTARLRQLDSLENWPNAASTRAHAQDATSRFVAGWSALIEATASSSEVVAPAA